MKMEKNTIRNILEGATGNALDVYATLYEKCMENKEDAPQMLQEILEYPEEIGVDDNASELVTAEEEERYRKMYKELLWDQTKKLMTKNLSQEEFYKELWESIFESDTAPDTKKKGAVCLKILNDDVPFVPYYEAVGLVQMEDGEYEKRLETLTPNIQESIYMLNRRFEQKTEETSQFCRIIRSLDERDAAVYLATLLNILKRAYVNEGYKKAMKKIEEEKVKSDDDIEEESN